MNTNTVNVYTFNPDELFIHISNNDWDKCWSYVGQLLENFSCVTNMQMSMRLQNDFSIEEKKKYVSEFGALAGEIFFALLTELPTKIPDQHFLSLIYHHETLHNLLSLAGIKNTDAYISSLLQSSKNLSDNDQKKLLLTLSLNTDLNIISILEKINPKFRVPAITSYIGYMKLFEKNIYKNKIKLYELRSDLERSNSDDITLSKAIFSYFSCSYIDHPDRHIIKKNINISIQNYLQRFKKSNSILSDRPSLKINLDPEKPVLAVFLEVFSKNHAMNRSWGNWVQSLSSEFSIVILVPEHKNNPILSEQYENVLTFSTIDSMISTIRQLSPDMMVYPSIGLDYFGVVASNIRFAPVQIMALGHPASTMSPHIDFVYGQSCLYKEEAFAAEKYIADDSPYQFIPSINREEIENLNIYSRNKNDKSPLKVSIVGSTLKVIYPFLEFLSDIEADFHHSIQFSFHLGSTGLDTLYLQKIISEKFKSSIFYGYQTYTEYLESMASADIILNPFPFGHTNTIIDTLLLGKPCIGLDGIEPSARTERCVLDMVGLSGQFIATDLDDYKKKFAEFASRILEGETVFYDREFIYKTLYNNGPIGDFGKVLKWIFDNQKELLASDQKFISYPL